MPTVRNDPCRGCGRRQGRRPPERRRAYRLAGGIEIAPLSIFMPFGEPVLSPGVVAQTAPSRDGAVGLDILVGNAGVC